MVIKVYVSSISGNMEIKKQQDFVMQILDTNKVEYESVDITDPSKEEEKMFMRGNSIPKEGQKNPLPPQIFNQEDYCGDFEALHDANECEEVMQFLKLEEIKPVSKASIELKETESPQLSSETLNIEQHQPQSGEILAATTTKVSTVTLGVLSAQAAGNVNDNSVRDDAKSDDDDSDDDNKDVIGYERLSDEDYESHGQTQDNSELNTSSKDNEHGDNVLADNNKVESERQDDSASLPDSIDGTADE